MSHEWLELFTCKFIGQDLLILRKYLGGNTSSCLRDTTLVVTLQASGIHDTIGKKNIVGLWQGATENATVCTNLLNDTERRGLDMGKDYLLVLDVSKVLRSAVARKFGSNFRMADYDKAKESLDLTKRYLERLNPSAAASLREGLEETLAVHWLCVNRAFKEDPLDHKPD